MNKYVRKIRELWDILLPSSITSTNITIFANFKIVCVTRSVGKRHAFLGFSKLLGNSETMSKLSQKRKISMGNVYWMIGNDMKIRFFFSSEKERDWNSSYSHSTPKWHVTYSCIQRQIGLSSYGLWFAYSLPKQHHNHHNHVAWVEFWLEISKSITWWLFAEMSKKGQFYWGGPEDSGLPSVALTLTFYLRGWSIYRPLKKHKIFNVFRQNLMFWRRKK